LLRHIERGTGADAAGGAGRYSHSEFQERGYGRTAAKSNGRSERATGRSDGYAGRSKPRPYEELGEGNEWSGWGDD